MGATVAPAAITPAEALSGREWAVVTRERPRRVYGLYRDGDTAARICRDLNRRYGEAYEVAHVEAGSNG